jgi:hypothetical protein
VSVHDPYGNLLEGLRLVGAGLANAGKHDSTVLVNDAVAEIRGLRRAVALHQPVTVVAGRICVECRKAWPCLTAHTAGTSNNNEDNNEGGGR